MAVVSDDQFKNIRPYNDTEVEPVLAKLAQHEELINTIVNYKYPRLAPFFGWVLKPLAKWYLGKQIKPITNVHDFQLVVEGYMTRMIDATTTKVTHSGLDSLDTSMAYLYMSNHRDIAMDPALLTYTMYRNGHDTLRIAIGDNLLTKDYVSDIMRLNKSFIVNRSAVGPRKILAAYKQLSAYISKSLSEDKVGIWIAQREGRAKNGLDGTVPAIIKMLTMSFDRKNDVFADFVRKLHIVPVAISYEYDPCDSDKAKELYIRESEGQYQKAEQEDVNSIAVSIEGNKGNVHIAFGEPMLGDFDSPEIVAAEVDRQIISNYVLHPSNFFAYKELHGVYPIGNYSAANISFDSSKLKAEALKFGARFAAVATEHKPYFLQNYANCIQQKIDFGFLPNPFN